MIKRWNHKSVKKEALKYKVRSEWETAAHGSYCYAKKHGLLEECSKHMKVQFRWTYELVKIEALKYKSKRDWGEASWGSYQYALRNKLLEELTKHMINPRIIWTYDTVRKESLKYSSSKEWRYYSNFSYNWAGKAGLIKEFTSHMTNLRKDKSKTPKLIKKNIVKVKREKLAKVRANFIIWNDDSVKQEALKYTQRSHWKAASTSSYGYDRRKKLLKKFTKHMGQPKTGPKWILDQCIKSSKKYNSKTEWINGDRNAYSAAWKHKWLDICCEHMSGGAKPEGFWNKEDNLIKEMNKYSSRREFIKNNPSAYHYALKKFKDLLNKQFPLIKSASTSLGENSTLLFLEKIFNVQFVKKKHDFLINPKTGRPLELDGYCELLKIAFEYGNHLELKGRASKKTLRKILEKDKFKVQKCKQLNIRLLQINIDSLRYEDGAIHLKNQIKDELIRHNIKIPKNYDKTQLKVVQFK
jgi:hypothetical protein